MLSIFLTFDVSKFDKFIEIKDEQPWNMQFIYSTFEVLILDKSIKVKDEHP